jgi:hypothetical protein
MLEDNPAAPMPLGGIGALGAPEMAHIVALVHEFGGCELHRGARGRRETRCHLREPRDQVDRRNQKAKPNSRTDRLAERTDVNDARIRSSDASAGAALPTNWSSLR